MAVDGYFILAIVMLVAGIVGTVLPALPGVTLCFGGVLVYKFLVQPEFPVVWVVIFGLITLLSLGMDYYLPGKLTQKYGGTKSGSVGGLLGLIAGFFLIPVPFGFLIGLAVGTFIGELIKNREDPGKAFQATKGAVMGFVASSIAQLGISLIFLVTILFDYFG